MGPVYRFNRMEFSGSLGDLGTLLPLAAGMIMVNGLDAGGVFLTIGLFFVLSGFYYGVTSPVQPMKVIGAYAVASGVSAIQITSAGLLVGVVLLIIGLSGMSGFIGRHTPKATVRGVQLSTGVLLMAKGVSFMTGSSAFQQLRGAAEPYLSLQSLGPVPIGIIIGLAACLITLILLNNRKLPAGLAVVAGGLILGLVLAKPGLLGGVSLGWHWPEMLPFGLPQWADLSFAILVLVMPQLPMTIGNAVIANADLAHEYFGKDAHRVTYRSLCVGMGLANIGTFLLGGMPLCTGAGGLAAHYRFGARTAGSNLMIGGLFMALALLLGSSALAVANLLPMAVLGALLVFAGGQLALTIIDLKEREDLFVCLLILGITLASNLAVGFLAGLVVAWAFKWGKLSV